LTFNESLIAFQKTDIADISRTKEIPPNQLIRVSVSSVARKRSFCVIQVQIEKSKFADLVGFLAGIQCLNVVYSCPIIALSKQFTLSHPERPRTIDI